MSPKQLLKTGSRTSSGLSAFRLKGGHSKKTLGLPHEELCADVLSVAPMFWNPGFRGMWGRGKASIGTAWRRSTQYSSCHGLPLPAWCFLSLNSVFRLSAQGPMLIGNTEIHMSSLLLV